MPGSALSSPFSSLPLDTGGQLPGSWVQCMITGFTSQHSWAGTTEDNQAPSWGRYRNTGCLGFPIGERRVSCPLSTSASQDHQINGLLFFPGASVFVSSLVLVGIIFLSPFSLHPVPLLLAASLTGWACFLWRHKMLLSLCPLGEEMKMLPFFCLIAPKENHCLKARAV